MTPALLARVEARVGTLTLDIELEAANETLVLLGPNGAGKTSLLSILLGSRPVRRGRVEIGGELLLDTAGSVDVPLELRRIGYVPQDYALFPHLTVRQNIEFALGSMPLRLAPGERRERTESLLRELGLTPLAERHPPRLSGGEKQRVALARALSVQPRALLLDEPLAALDIAARREVRAFLARYLDELRLPTIVVTHDPEDARSLGRTIAVLEAGRIVQRGTWPELVARPASSFVASFVGAPGL